MQIRYAISARADLPVDRCLRQTISQQEEFNLPVAVTMTFLDRLLRFKSMAEAASPPIGELVSTASGTVHALQSGEPGQIPVVLIHGASGNVRDWHLSVMPDLARDHHVIALDRPGFGYTDALPIGTWDLSPQIDVLRGALQAIGYDRYILVGHSYGGSIVLRWALDFPEEIAGLGVLGAPSQDWGGGHLSWTYRLGGNPVIGPLLSRFVPLMASPGYIASELADVFLPHAVTPGYLEEGGGALAARPATWRTNAVQMLHLYRALGMQWDRYSAITCPTTIVHGRRDEIVPWHIHVDKLHAAIGGSTLTVIEDAGHMLHHDNRTAVTAEINALIARAVGEDTNADHARRDHSA